MFHRFFICGYFAINACCMIFCTLPVAATSFFAGEVEIYDFVTERAKRCIAANNENEQKIFWETYNDGWI